MNPLPFDLAVVAAGYRESVPDVFYGTPNNVLWATLNDWPVQHPWIAAFAPRFTKRQRALPGTHFRFNKEDWVIWEGGDPHVYMTETPLGLVRCVLDIVKTTDGDHDIQRDMRARRFNLSDATPDRLRRYMLWLTIERGHFERF